MIVSLNERGRECAKNILSRMFKSDIDDVKGTSAIERNQMSTATNAVCLITVLTASSSVHFEKLCCSLRAFALVFSIVFYNRIMATCSPSQERQLVLMESMNRRLDSFLESLQQENVKLRTGHGLSKQERLNYTKRGSKLKRTESKIEVPVDLRVGLRAYFMALMLEEKLFILRDQSLCLFFRADRVIACLQRRRHACVVIDLR